MNLTSYSILLIVLYFIVLYSISYFTSKGASNKSFFSANKSGKWYLVAFGMIGASLSGVTFLSVPGWVASSGMSYMQVVLGYMIGYVVVAHVLLPVYYKMNLTSIYTYLQRRYGENAYLTGSWFFLLSRTIGACFRLFLVAKVFQVLIFDPLEIPFAFNVAITILLIWVYTLKGGIKTIIWTDTLQTFLMLLAAGLTTYFLMDKMDLSLTSAVSEMKELGYAKIFHFSDAASAKFFFNQILSGAMITIAMTGIDQDMMQKNLTCKNLKEGQKNVWSLSLSLVPVNLLFLFLGGLLSLFAIKNNLDVTEGDQLFSTVMTSGLVPSSLAIVFLLGLIAAAYSSADSALTSLTTSFCVDILKIEEDTKENVKKRKKVHLGISFVLFLLILGAYAMNKDHVIKQIFIFAGYTYGPLVGMFFFGLISKRNVDDRKIPWIAISSPILAFAFTNLMGKLGVDIGFLVLLVNSLICFTLMALASYMSSPRLSEDTLDGDMV